MSSSLRKKLDSPHRADYHSPIPRRSPRRGTSGVTEGLARQLWPATLASPLVHEAFPHGPRYYKVFVSLCAYLFYGRSAWRPLRHIRAPHQKSREYWRLSPSDQPFHQTVSSQRLTHLFVNVYSSEEERSNDR